MPIVGERRPTSLIGCNKPFYSILIQYANALSVPPVFQKIYQPAPIMHPEMCAMLAKQDELAPASKRCYSAQQQLALKYVMTVLGVSDPAIVTNLSQEERVKLALKHYGRNLFSCFGVLFPSPKSGESVFREYMASQEKEYKKTHAALFATQLIQKDKPTVTLQRNQKVNPWVQELEIVALEG